MESGWLNLQHAYLDENFITVFDFLYWLGVCFNAKKDSDLQRSSFIGINTGKWL